MNTRKIRQLKKSLETLKNGFAAYFALILLYHTVQPLQVMGAEPISSIEPGQVLVDGDSSIDEDSTPEPVVIVPPTVQDVLLEVCQARGYGVDCAKHLLGMLWKESNNKATAIGDHGKARGYFQIHYKLHKVPLACAEDLRCSAEWTLTYLERNSYPKYVAYAIQCHNGCNIDNGYAASVRRHGARLWATPLAVNAGAPEPDFKMAIVKK